jgi:hypothetical protein
MKTRHALLGCFLFAAGLAAAADLATKDGKVYPDVAIAEVTPIGLAFISGGKAGWVDFRDLPEEVARKYGYDPKKAAAFEAQIEKNGGNMVGPNDAPDTAGMPAEAALDPQQVPMSATNTVEVVDGQPVVYEPQYFPSSGPVYCNRWVYWHGHRYPYYWWHHWYWGHHWVYHHGRYYPWHYYHGHGVWYHGKYYPYHHGVLGPHHCGEAKPHGAAHHGGREGGGGGKGGRR